MQHQARFLRSARTSTVISVAHGAAACHYPFSRPFGRTPHRSFDLLHLPWVVTGGHRVRITPPVRPPATNQTSSYPAPTVYLPSALSVAKCSPQVARACYADA